MGAVKTEKKEFSFSNKKKKQRVREVEGNKKQNGRHHNGILNWICVYSQSCACSWRKPLVTHSIRSYMVILAQKKQTAMSFLSQIAALPQDEIVLINISPSGRQAAKRLETWKWVTAFWLPAAGHTCNVIFTQFNLISVMLSTIQWKMLCFSWKK